MASLILGVVGSAIGGPVGFLIGSAIGSLIDRQMNKKTIEGPRLDDKRVQNSAYGTMIPILRGTMGVAGNVIWATDLQEESSTEEAGGKGDLFGGGDTLKQYTYFANFAVSLCEGPIQSVRRIWANGRLWYDAGATNQGFQGFWLYHGTEDQLPDPTMESFEGVGNVPAYRGQAYIVFRHLPVAPFGNQLPQLFFEVCESSSETFAIDSLHSQSPNGSVDPHFPVFASDGSMWASGVQDIQDVVYRVDPYTGDKLSTWEMAGSLGAGGNTLLLQPISGGRFWGAQSDELYLIDPNARTARAVYRLGGSLVSGNIYTEPGSMATVGDDLVCFVRVRGTNNRVAIRVKPTGHPLNALFPYCTNESVVLWDGNQPLRLANQTNVSFFDNFTWNNAYGAADGEYFYGLGISIGTLIPVSDNGPYRIYRLRLSDLHLVDYTDGPTTPTSTPGFSFLMFEGYLYVGAASRIDKWDPATMTRVGYVAGGSEMPPVCRWLSLTEDNQILQSGGITVATTGNPDGINAYLVDPHEFSTSSVVGVLLPGVSGGNGGLGKYTKDPISGRVVGVTWSAPAALVYRLRTGIINSNLINLADVVGSYLDRAGVDPVQYDVAALSAIDMRGTLVARQMACRSAIEPLASAYLFDALESDAVIKFVLRGADPVLTIPDDDLADTGSDTPRVSIERAQDVDLPLTVNVNYFEPSRDYQQGTQYARRFAGFSDNNLTVEVPVAFEPDEGKAIAETWLYNAWVERQRFLFATGPKYAALEPTDVVTLRGYVIRIDKRSEEGLLIKWEGVNDAQQIYLQDASGATGEGGAQEPPGSSVAQVLYLDIPLLRDADDSAGFYLAANGIPPAGWPGAQVYKSIDEGNTFTPYYAITVPSTFGQALSALATWSADDNFFDELHTVDVQVNGSLSSTTELAVLNGANLVLIGSEVAQFKIATLIATGVYRLSGLLRGRLGTEWANGTHAIGERVVLLNNNLRNAAHPTSELNQARTYKAVTFGFPLEAGTQVPFTNTGVRHECYAPVQVGGGIASTSDWVLTWNRRTRLSDGWIDLVDAPLGETSESYEVDIMSGSTVKRTLTSSTPTVTYTSAQQVTDFGSNQTALSVRVYQLSALAGRGYVSATALPPP